jgi:hypothetical protein
LPQVSRDHEENKAEFFRGLGEKGGETTTIQLFIDLNRGRTQDFVDLFIALVVIFSTALESVMDFTRNIFSQGYVEATVALGNPNAILLKIFRW